MSGIRGLRKAVEDARQSSPSSPLSVAIDTQARPVTPAGGFQLDAVLKHLDVTFVSAWLRRTQEAVRRLRIWWDEGDNAINFSHFWLTEMSASRRRDLVMLERELLLEELSLAWRVGLEDRRVSVRDLQRVVRAVFRELPDGLLEANGGGTLDILRALAAGGSGSGSDSGSGGGGGENSSVSAANSSAGDEYRQLLTRVRVNTATNKQYLQWLLALRSFCLVQVTGAAVQFYSQYADAAEVATGLLDRPGTAAASQSCHRNNSDGCGSGGLRRPTSSAGRRETAAAVISAQEMTSEFKSLSLAPLPTEAGGPLETTGRPATAAGARTDVRRIDELFRAIRAGVPDLVAHLLSAPGAPSVNVRDGLGRTPVMVAVLNKQEAVLHLLLERAMPRESRTKLKLEDKEKLREEEGEKRGSGLPLLDLDAQAESGNTALHAAIMSGEPGLARLLLMAGANPEIANEEMGGATPLLLATIQGDEEMVRLLTRYSGHKAADTAMMSAEGRPMTARDVARETGIQSLVSAMDGMHGGGGL